MAIKKSKDSNVIDVYSWPTPNGHKVHIMLEECGYRLGRDWVAHPIDIGAGDQFDKAFLKISPNNKIPALIDPHGPDGDRKSTRLNSSHTDISRMPSSA